RPKPGAWQLGAVMGFASRHAIGREQPRMIVLDPARVNAFLKASERIVGVDHVTYADEARYAYADSYAPKDPASYAPKGAVAPASAEEVQALVRLAGEHGVPLWPISRGKNYGYGGAAPRIGEMVTL